MITFSVTSHRQDEFINITHSVADAVRKSNLNSGVVTVFIPHTTAGITINENADPDVTADLLRILRRLVPWDDPDYRHFEGNTAAHLKAVFTGSSVQVIVENGHLQLGTWQGIYFCEFDGPRQRRVFLKITGEQSG